MKEKVSLPGLLFGAFAALATGLLASQDSFAWLAIGVAVGMILGAVLTRRSPEEAGLRKGEQR